MIFRQNLRIAFPLLFIGILMIFLAPISEGATKIFPLEKIKPGMNGYGYTVFSGTKIEKFTIRVLALVDDSVGKEKLILVKLSGREIEKNGGLSAGMSGSPIYIRNRLVGAISYGFENADSSLALVTPIDSMLKLFSHEVKISGEPKLSIKAVPVMTPVMISGMKRRGFELISKLLEPYGMKTISLPNTGASNLEMGKNLIQPGSAIAVLMVAGDYQVSAIGTVTWVDGKNFLAFGHSYTNKGQVDYFAYQANIFQTVKSSIMSFKIGAPLKMIGRVIQDRQAGVYGRFVELPTSILVQVIVKDEDRNLTKNSSFYVINGDQIFPDLIIAGVTDAIDQTIDRVGPGTARVTVSIETNDGQLNIDKENMFYGKDIAASCIKDLQDLLEIINANDFLAIPLKSIRVNVELKAEQTSARVVKLDSEVKKVKPGDILKLNARLHSYRGDNLTVPFEIKIPLNIKSEKINLTIYGGSRESANGQDEGSKKEPLKLDYKDVQSFKDLLTNYLAKPKNYELVLEYDPFTEQKAAESDKINSEVEIQNSKPVQQKIATRYYLLGEAQLTIEVEKPN